MPRLLGIYKNHRNACKAVIATLLVLLCWSFEEFLDRHTWAAFMLGTIGGWVLASIRKE